MCKSKRVKEYAKKKKADAETAPRRPDLNERAEFPLVEAGSGWKGEHQKVKCGNLDSETSPEWRMRIGMRDVGAYFIVFKLYRVDFTGDQAI